MFFNSRLDNSAVGEAAELSLVFFILDMRRDLGSAFYLLLQLTED